MNININILPGMVGQLLSGVVGACAAILGTNIQIGSGTSNSSSAPFYGLYDYSWYGGIWAPDEFTGSASNEIQITGIEVERGSTTTGYPTNNMEIWISEIDENEFSTTPQVDGADLTKTNETKVFDGNLTWLSGWNNINFNTTFCYSGTKSLLVEFRNHDGTWQSGYGHGEYQVAVDKAAHNFDDDAYPTGTGVQNNSRINTRFKY